MPGPAARGSLSGCTAAGGGAAQLQHTSQQLQHTNHLHLPRATRQQQVLLGSRLQQRLQQAALPAWQQQAQQHQQPCVSQQWQQQPLPPPPLCRPGAFTTTRQRLASTCRAAAASSHAFSDDSSSNSSGSSNPSSSSSPSSIGGQGVFAAAATFTSGLADTASDLQELLQRFLGLWRKFLPMLSLFFCLSFINTMLDSLKDTLVITAAGGGAFVIPYLTVYAVLPLSMIFLITYTAASHRVSRSVLFNVIVAGFVAFFGFFALFLYPNADALHPHALADQLQQVLPRGLAGAVGMWRNWTFTLFFCMAELWGDVCMGLLFWGLANEITNLSDAATLYPLFGLGANLAQAIAGLVLKATTRGGAREFATALQASMAAVVVIACIAICLQQYISNKAEAEAAALRHRQQHRHNSSSTSSAADLSRAASPALSTATTNAPQQTQQAQTQPQQPPQQQAEQQKPKKPQPSMAATFRVLLASVEIRCLACMSLAQGLCNSLMEFAWKCHMRLLYPNPGDFTAFLGDVATWSGVVTGSLMLMSPLLFERLGWRGVANTTPTILLYGGSAFFLGCIVYQHLFGHTVAGAGAAAAGPAGMALLQGLVIFGALLYVFGRGAKFSLFKPAEEMVYITLDEDGRTRGKAAIDVVGAQTGKSGGSLLQQALLITSAGSIVGIMPVLFAVFFAMLRGWSSAVHTLSSVRHYSYDSPISSLEEDEGPEQQSASLAAAAAAAADGSSAGGSSSALGAAEQQELLDRLQGLAAEGGAESTQGSGSKSFQAAVARSSSSGAEADAPAGSSGSAAADGGSSGSLTGSNSSSSNGAAGSNMELITLSHDAAQAFRRSRREGAAAAGAAGHSNGSLAGAGHSGTPSSSSGSSSDSSSSGSSDSGSGSSSSGRVSTDAGSV